MSYKGYTNQIEFIKNEYNKFYIDKGPENGILQGTKYAGAATHARNCLYTLVKMLDPVNALEIGSMHYASSDAIADGMDYLRGINGEGIVDSFDIKRGGYTGETQYLPKNRRVRPGFWYPCKTYWDTWKYDEDPLVVFPEFKNMTDAEIEFKNTEILNERTKPFGKYDLIFIDGDHSFDGAKQDYEMALKFSHESTVIVIDNVWDLRLNEVRQFYDSLKTIKWDFEEWNDQNYKNNMVMDNAVSLTY